MKTMFNMRRGKRTLRRKIASSLSALFMTAAILITLSGQEGFPLDIPTWNDVFTYVRLKPVSNGDDNPFAVHFIDVGQGDSVFINSVYGCILIDGGEDGCGEKIISYIGALGVRSIDYVIATHPHSDHIGGLDEIIDAFEIKNVIMPRLSEINTPTTRRYEDFLKAVGKSGAKVIAAKQGAGYELGKVYMLILSPVSQSKDLNDMSVVARVSYGKTFFLFTGDAGSTVEKEIARGEYADFLRADVLKAGHHGSKTSSSVSFLNKVRPDSIIISCGEGNSYGHPHNEALQRMEKSGADILRTDKSGTIIVSSDGESLNFKTEKE